MTEQESELFRKLFRAWDASLRETAALRKELLRPVVCSHCDWLNKKRVAALSKGLALNSED